MNAKTYLKKNHTKAALLHFDVGYCMKMLNVHNYLLTVNVINNPTKQEKVIE